MEYIKDLLTTHLNISEQEWATFQRYLVYKEFNAKSLVVREEMVAQHIYFIDSGLMRSYYLEDGKEINTYFACDGALMTVFSSFLRQQPSLECLEAVEIVQLIVCLMKLYINCMSNFLILNDLGVFWQSKTIFASWIEQC